MSSPIDFKMSSSVMSCSVESESSRLIKALSESQPKAKASALGDFLHTAAGETAFCRDFTCCGVKLNDLHALVEHFEDVHVRVVASQPPISAPQLNTQLQAAGYDLDELDMDLEDRAPSPASPGTPPQTPLAPFPSAFDTASVFLPFRRGPESSSASFYGLPHTALSRTFTNAVASSATESPCIQPALLRRTPDSTPQPSPPNSPTKATTSLGKVANQNAQQSQRAIVTGPIVPNAATDPRPPLPGGKPFRCPHPNCTKSYKQANGLKYHLTHGQCSFLPPDPVLETMTDQEADERMRPFVCAVAAPAAGKGGGCGRRYKNMNGLRKSSQCQLAISHSHQCILKLGYHYQHSGAHGAAGLAMLAAGTHPQPPEWAIRAAARSRTQSTVSTPVPSTPVLSRPPSNPNLKINSSAQTLSVQEQTEDMEMDFD